MISSLLKRAEKWRAQILCLLGSILLFLAATFLAAPKTDLAQGRVLPRDSYGGRTETYSIIVDGLSEQPVTLDIPVMPRTYREDEINNVFEACMEVLSSTIPGENSSPAEILTDLDLPSSLPQYGVRVTWLSSDPTLLSPYGEVSNEDLLSPEDVELSAHLTDAEGLHSADYVIPLTILPAQFSEEEQLRRSFLRFLAGIDKTQASDGSFSLPQEYRGKRLNYRQKPKENYYILLFLGPLLSALFYLRDRQNAGSEAKDRRNQMLLDYPEIISKLMVFIGAGMTIRLAWGAIVNDYESGGGPKRWAYEEMTRAYHQLRTGANEGKVYRDFGRACGLRQYMKLAGLLEQNRKTGLAGIRTILSAEMTVAWEDRKNTARRLGEEAGTKLLGPLFIMLVIVMVMIIVPALLSF